MRLLFERAWRGTFSDLGTATSSRRIQGAEEMRPFSNLDEYDYMLDILVDISG